MKRLLDVDQLLIFILLAVTVNQMGHYLSTFAPPGLGFVGYLQAIAIDLAIWRSAYWFRRYTGRRQRLWAGLGVAVFAVVSAWYNGRYYELHTKPGVEPWLMGAVLPLGVALLSYLYGVKDGSRFATTAQSDHPTKPNTDLVTRDSVIPRSEPAIPQPASFVCMSCGRSFRSANGLNSHSPRLCAERHRKAAETRRLYG